MKRINNKTIMMLFVSLCTTLVACGPTRPDEKWSLPKREGNNTGMIIGRLDYPDNKSENPKNKSLNIYNVDFWKDGKSVYFNANGEPSITLNNNYFVVPNLQPGKYYFVGFKAGKNYYKLPRFDDKYMVEVKPGQIVYYGSIDYLDGKEPGWFREGTYSLRKVAKPSEREMLQWFYEYSEGTGWDTIIKKRLQALGEHV